MFYIYTVRMILKPHRLDIVANCNCLLRTCSLQIIGNVRFIDVNLNWFYLKLPYFKYELCIAANIFYTSKAFGNWRRVEWYNVPFVPLGGVLPIVTEHWWIVFFCCAIIPLLVLRSYGSWPCEEEPMTILRTTQKS